MTKFLRRETAKKCPIHQAIQEEAVKRLEHNGAFSKQEILEDLNYQAMEDSIRWEYIREFIEEDQGCELIPLSELYFRSTRTNERKTNPMNLKPEKYIASGHGKRTAGYGSVGSDENSCLVIVSLDQKEKQVMGKYKATVRLKKNALDHGANNLKKAMEDREPLRLEA